LVEKIGQISKDQFQGKHYRFFSFNCATFLLDLLGQSGFHQTERIFPMRPTQVFNHFRKSFLTPWPENKGVDVSLLKKVTRNMNSRTVKDLDTLTLQRIIVFTQADLGASIKQDLKGEIKLRSDRQDSNRVFDIEKYPQGFYQLPLANTGEIASYLKQNYSRKALRELSIYNRASMATLYPGQMVDLCSGKSANCDYFEAATLLLQDASASP
jgi:hypothetical protein